MFLSVAMVLTMLPASVTMADDEAAGGEPAGVVTPASPTTPVTPSELVLHYDMSHANGKLTDASGNNLHGILHNITDADFSANNDRNVLSFDGEAGNSNNGKYVEIPIAKQLMNGITETFAIEATYTTTDSVESNAWLFTLGSDTGGWPRHDYLFVSPNTAQNDYKGKLLGAITQGSASGNEKRYPTSKLLTGNGVGIENTVKVVFEAGNVTYYLNGEASDVTETNYSIQKILTAGTSDEKGMGYIGKSLYDPDDPYFKGTLLDFKIYRAPVDKELEANTTLRATVLEKLKKAMLNKNASADEVITDLSFPATLEGIGDITFAWTSSDTSIIDNTGKIVSASANAQNVDISVTGTYENKAIIQNTYKLRVISQSGAEKEAFDAMELELPDKNNVKGSFILPTSSRYGTEIAWSVKSPEETDVITIVEKDKYAVAQITRPAADTEVTLTAALKLGSDNLTRDFKVKVIKKDDAGIMTDYVFAYFIGNGAGEEQIYLASSRDGLNWEELNEGKPILESDLGTKGLRDPFIFRSHDGSKFYLIATDLCIASDGNWTTAQQEGSQAIMVWESEDLVNWSEQRMVTVSAGIEAGCTWAPEVYYDEEAEAYMLFWASKVKEDNYAKQRMYYCTTKDFVTFTEPQVWVDEEHSTIDITVVRDDDGTYYRFNKNESRTFIYMEKADSLHGPWTKVNENIASGVEGPCCFRFNDDDVADVGATWCLLLDNFGAGGYYPMVTNSLASGDFTRISANLPSKPRHGTVMNITADEYDAIMNAYGLPSAEDSVPSYVVTGYELPDTISVQFKGEEVTGVKVEWDKTAEAFAQKGTVTVKGTLSGTGNSRIDGYEFTKTIEVVSDKLIYFVDSGVGSGINDNALVSDSFEAIKSLGDKIKLRNTVPDQKAEADGAEWGIVNSGTNEGGYAVVTYSGSAADTIFKNGYWARSDKYCEYVFPLEEGTYAITGYFSEWWNNRKIDLYAEYTNTAGETVKSDTKVVEISTSNNNKSETVELKVKDIAEGEKVHIYAKKSGSSKDPVIAGVSIEKLATKEEDEALGVLEELFDQVGVTKTEYSLAVDDSADIEVKYPEGFADKLTAAGCEVSVAYKSDNNAVTVDENGKVQAVAEGTAKITVTFTLTRNSQTVKTVSKTVTVNVAKNEQQIAEEAAKAALEEITLAKSNYELTAGDTATITVNYPEGFKDKLTAAGLTATTRYSADNAAVSVNDSGKITAAAAGTATITVTVTLNDADATSKSLTAAVKVKAKQQSGGDNQGGTNQGDGTTQSDTTPAKIKLSVTKAFSLGLGESTKLTATVTNKAGEVLKNQKITWSVDKKGKKAVTVKNGKITASKKKTGTATITAKTSNGKTAKVKVTVKKKPTKITITYPKKKSVTLKKGKTLKLKTKVTPSKAASYKITYKSSKKKVASVSDKGVVKALKKGTATITVKTYNGKSAKVKVTVK